MDNYPVNTTEVHRVAHLGPLLSFDRNHLCHDRVHDRVAAHHPLEQILPERPRHLCPKKATNGNGTTSRECRFRNGQENVHFNVRKHVNENIPVEAAVPTLANATRHHGEECSIDVTRDQSQARCCELTLGGASGLSKRVVSRKSNRRSLFASNTGSPVLCGILIFTFRVGIGVIARTWSVVSEYAQQPSNEANQQLKCQESCITLRSCQ